MSIAQVWKFVIKIALSPNPSPRGRGEQTSRVILWSIQDQGCRVLEVGYGG